MRKIACECERALDSQLIGPANQIKKYRLQSCYSTPPCSLHKHPSVPLKRCHCIYYHVFWYKNIIRIPVPFSAALSNQCNRLQTMLTLQTPAPWLLSVASLSPPKCQSNLLLLQLPLSEPHAQLTVFHRPSNLDALPRTLLLICLRHPLVRLPNYRNLIFCSRDCEKSAFPTCQIFDYTRRHFLALTQLDNEKRLRKNL